MSYSQPPYRTNGPPRGGHDGNRGTSHNTSQQSNGNGYYQQTSPGNAGSFQQQTNGANGSPNQQPPNPPQNPQYGRTQHAAYGQPGTYVPVPRPWGYPNPEIARVMNNPALDVAPPRNGYRHTPHYAPPPAPPPPPPPPPAHPPNGRNAYQLNAANLQRHDRRRPPRDSLRRFERQAQRSGPYDAVGGIRADGQVFDEDTEWSDDYHEYDA